MPKPKADLSQALRILKKTYPDVECALYHETPLQLLVATILSAQCTDKRVNMVTPALFARFKTARDFASAPVKELENIIKSTGFFRQKARWIQAACRIIDQKYGGEVPRDFDKLTQLPGVARKTANVVMGTAFKVASGVVVDTHVKRIAKKLGFTRHEDPVKVEQDLLKVLKKPDWIWFSHAIITHGRQICKAVNPQCLRCPLIAVCPAREA